MAGYLEHGQVVRAAAGGDDRALEQLVRTYHDRVHAFGRRVCRDPFDADDAVQEAFATLARRRDVAQNEGVLGWLLTVVRNACLRLLRPFRTARVHLGQQVEDVDAVPAAQLDPEEALARWRLVEGVHRAIAALDGPHREVLVLRDIEGQSGAEVCAALGLSSAAMKSRLHRARQQVKEQLSGLAAPPPGRRR